MFPLTCVFHTVFILLKQLEPVEDKHLGYDTCDLKHGVISASSLELAQ